MVAVRIAKHGGVSGFQILKMSLLSADVSSARLDCEQKVVEVGIAVEVVVIDLGDIASGGELGAAVETVAEGVVFEFFSTLAPTRSILPAKFSGVKRRDHDRLEFSCCGR